MVANQIAFESQHPRQLRRLLVSGKVPAFALNADAAAQHKRGRRRIGARAPGETP